MFVYKCVMQKYTYSLVSVNEKVIWVTLMYILSVYVHNLIDVSPETGDAIIEFDSNNKLYCILTLVKQFWINLLFHWVSNKLDQNYVLN